MIASIFKMCIRDRWEEGGVNLVLCGHQHFYARSKPMYQGKVDDEKGITYVMGNSGQKFYSDADDRYQEVVIGNKSTYQVIHVTKDTLELKCFDRQGVELDSWSLSAKGKVTGDVNGDSLVDLQDVRLVKEAILSRDYQGIMDVNTDGALNVRDAELILNLYLQSQGR